MKKEPCWLTEKIIKIIQKEQLQQHGGSIGIRKANLS